MNSLVVIPARGGSKRLPGKNIKPLNGKPLIHYTIEAAREVFDDSIICVSTDDEKIKRISEETGLNVPFLRPAELATDSADTRSVLLHAYDFYLSEKNYKADVIILLQPTSPLRRAKHIRESVELYKNNIDMVVSVKETKSNPYFVLYEEDQYGYLQKSKKGTYTRKQDAPKVWEINGALYVIKVKSLKKRQPAEFERVVKYEMGELESLDIDTELDLKLLRTVIDDS